MQNVRYSTTFPVMFSPHLFSTSAYRMFTTSIDHHSSSAVLTISFFHLRLQNIRYVTTSVLCAFTVLFSLSLSSISAYRTFGTSPLLCCARLLCCSHYLFLPSPPTEHSVRHYFCAVRVYCGVLTISFFHLRLQNIRYVTTSVLCAFTVVFSLSLSSISAYRTFGTSLLLCCARLLSSSHYLFLPSPPAEGSVRHHFCAVLTFSFFHLHLQNVQYVDHHSSSAVLNVSFFHLREMTQMTSPLLSSLYISVYNSAYRMFSTVPHDAFALLSHRFFIHYHRLC